MAMEEDLLALLRADTDLTALIATRSHWNVRPKTQKQYPAITLRLVSDPTDYTTTGRSSLRTSRVQIDVWALTYTSVCNVARAVTAAIYAADAARPSGSITNMSVDSDRDLTDDTATDIIFQRSIDVLINSNEP